MDINKLKDAIADKNAFRSIFINSWGRVLTECEKNNIFPPKEFIVDFQDASILPFLFKHYHLTDEEYNTIKNRVKMAQNISQISNEEPSGTEMLDSSVIEIIEKREDIDFMVYENILQAFKDNNVVPFLPGHNIAILERLIDDGAQFSDTEEYSCLNYSWVKNVLLAATKEEFEALSGRAVAVLNDIVSDDRYDEDSPLNKLRVNSSYINKFVTHSKDVYFYNIQDSLDVINPDIFYTVFKKAWDNRDNDDFNGGLYNLKYAWSSYIENEDNNIDLSVIKEISDNKIINFWDESDLISHKKLFLDNFFYRSNVFQNTPLRDNIGTGKFDWGKIFDKNDAIEWFDSIKKNFSQDLWDYDNNETLNINAVLILTNFTKHLLNSDIDKNDITFKNFVFILVSKVKETNWLPVDRNVLCEELINQGKPSVELGLTALHFNIKPNFLDELNPIDIQILKECGLDVGVSTGNPNALPSKGIYSNDILINKLICEKLLESQTYIRELSKRKVINSESDLMDWNSQIFLSPEIIPFILGQIKDNPKWLKNLSENNITVLERCPDFREFLPSKQYISYEKFINLNTGISDLLKVRDSLEEYGGTERNKDTLKKLYGNLEEMKNLCQAPVDIIKEHCKTFLLRRDWNDKSIMKDNTRYLIDALMDVELSLDEVKDFFNVTKISLNDHFFVADKIDYNNLSEGKAAIILELINNSLEKGFNSGSFRLDLEKNLKDKEAFKETLIETAIHHYPHLLIDKNIFSLTTNYYPVEQRIDFLKNAFSCISDKCLKTVMSESSLKGRELVYVHESKKFITALKEVDWSIKEKIVIGKIFKDKANKFTINADDLSRLLSSFNIKNDFILENKDFVNNEFEGSSSGLFPEFLNEEYVTKNIKEISDATKTLSFDWNGGVGMILFPNIDANGNFFKALLNKTPTVLEKIAIFDVENSNKDNLTEFINLFIKSTIKAEEIIYHININDKNFESFFDSLNSLNGEDVFYNVNKESKKKKSIVLQSLLINSFTSNDLSDENKNTLLGVIKMCSISKNLYSYSSFPESTIKLMLADDVLISANAYEQKTNLENIFSKFDVNFANDDDTDNSFKI